MKLVAGKQTYVTHVQKKTRTMQDITFISWPVRGNEIETFTKIFRNLFSRGKRRKRKGERERRIERKKNTTHGPRIAIIPI